MPGDRITFPPFGKSIRSTFEAVRAPELIAEDVVVVVKEADAPKYRIGAKGDPHPDTTRYPSHYLELIIPSEDGKTAKWFYVHKRAPLVSTKMTQEGQVATTTISLVDLGDPAPAVSALTLEAEQIDLANSSEARRTVITVPEVFGSKVFSSEVLDIVPPEFKAAIPVTKTAETKSGTAQAPVLGTGDLSKTDEQVGVFKHRLTTTGRGSVSLPVSQSNRKVNEQKQNVTVTRTLQLSTDAQAPNTALQSVNVTSLGNNTVLQEVESVPNIFPATSRQVGTPLVIPERFRATDGVSTTENIQAGAVPPTITLQSGEVERQEIQLSEFTKRVKTTAFTLGSTPTLEGQEYDQVYDVPIPYEERLEASGTSLGSNKTEVSPLSSTVDLVKTISPDTTVFDNYVLSFPGTTNISLPDELVSVDAFVETQSAVGDDSQTSAAGVITNSGSFTSSPHSSAQSSITAMPDVTPLIRQRWGANKKIAHYVFLLPSPVTSAQVLGKLTRLASTSSATVTMSSATDFVSWTSHGMVDGDTVAFSSTGSLLSPLTVDTIYYVVNSTSNTFKVALLSGGSAINLTGSQTGVHTGYVGFKDWPRFNPQTETIFCVGGRAAVMAKADAYYHFGENTCNACASDELITYHGNGASKEIGITIKAVRIPATIHGDIFFTGFDSDFFAVTADASANAYGTSDSRFDFVELAAYVTPSSLSATTGATAIPTTGQYVLNTDGAPYRYGYIRFHCEVLNAADL